MHKLPKYYLNVHTHATTDESIGFSPIPIQITTANVIIKRNTRTATWWQIMDVQNINLSHKWTAWLIKGKRTKTKIIMHAYFVEQENRELSITSIPKSQLFDGFPHELIGKGNIFYDHQHLMNQVCLMIFSTKFPESHAPHPLLPHHLVDGKGQPYEKNPQETHFIAYKRTIIFNQRAKYNKES